MPFVRRRRLRILLVRWSYARVARSQPMRACEVRLRDEWGGGGLVSSISERTWPPRNFRDVWCI